MLNLKELRREIRRSIEDNDTISIDDVLDYIHYEYISDSYSAYADHTIPIYYSDILKALKENNIEDYMQDAIYSIDTNNYDLYQHIQAAYYIMILGELDDKDTYFKEYYIINKLIEDYDITDIKDTVYYDLVNIGDLSRIEKIYKLDEIVDEIVEEVE